MHKPLLYDANYDSKNNDSTNALHPRRFNSVIFPQILYDIVLYARHSLPVKFFFPKYYFNKLYFELLTRVISTSTGINGVRLAHNIS